MARAYDIGVPIPGVGYRSGRQPRCFASLHPGDLVTVRNMHINAGGIGLLINVLPGNPPDPTWYHIMAAGRLITRAREDLVLVRPPVTYAECPE